MGERGEVKGEASLLTGTTSGGRKVRKNSFEGGGRGGGEREKNRPADGKTCGGLLCHRGKKLNQIQSTGKLSKVKKGKQRR